MNLGISCSACRGTGCAQGVVNGFKCEVCDGTGLAAHAAGFSNRPKPPIFPDPASQQQAAAVSVVGIAEFQALRFHVDRLQQASDLFEHQRRALGVRLQEANERTDTLTQSLRQLEKIVMDSFKTPKRSKK